jgi:tetratricopeptide (TPR) repeat protein
MLRIIGFVLIFASISFADAIIDGRANLFKGKVKEARVIFSEELKRKPCPYLLFLLADCYQKEGEPTFYKKIDLANCPPFYESIRDGLWYLYQGSSTLAYSSFEKAKIESAYSLIGMGLARKAEGKLKEAEKLYFAAKEKEPTCHLSYLHLFFLYSMKGNKEKATEVLAEGITKTNSPELIYEFSDLLLKEGSLKPATDLLLELERIEPNNILIKEKIAFLLLNKGIPMEEVPTKISSDESERLYLDGILALSSQFYSTALRRFSSIGEKDPGFYLARLKILWLYKELSIRGDAERLYKELIKKMPGDSLPDLFMSDIYGKVGSYTESLSYAEQAIRKEPFFDRPYFALGNAYYYNNRFIEAVLAYQKGFWLSKERRTLKIWIEEAFVNKYFPLFCFGYTAVWIATLFLLALIHCTGMFLIRGYPALKRYVIKKRWVFYLYLGNFLILFFSSLFGKGGFKFIPLDLLKEALFFLTIVLPIGILIILMVSLLISFIIKIPKIRIYLSFILLDFSLDIAIILMLASMLPVFTNNPEIFEIFSIGVIIFRRGWIILLLFPMSIFWLWYNASIHKGYRLIEEEKTDEAISLFRKRFGSLGFIRWLEPTYSHMASSAFLGEIYGLIKQNKWEEIPFVWKPIEKSLGEWWPLNDTSVFLYQWTNLLFRIKNGESVESELGKMLETPEYRKRKRAIYALLSLSEGKRDEYLSQMAILPKDKDLEPIIKEITNAD